MKMTTRIRLVCTACLYYAYVDIFKANILQSDDLTYAIYDNQEKRKNPQKLRGLLGRELRALLLCRVMGSLDGEEQYCFLTVHGQMVRTR